jgi:hypothetical protein
MSYQTKFLISLAFAIAVETAVAFLVLRRVFKLRELGNLQIAYAGIVATFSSLPYIWFVLPAFIRSYVAYAVVGETLVVLWEAFFYHMYLRIDLKRATILSLLANATSCVLGVPYQRLFA